MREKIFAFRLLSTRRLEAALNQLSLAMKRRLINNSMPRKRIVAMKRWKIIISFLWKIHILNPDWMNRMKNWGSVDRSLEYRKYLTNSSHNKLEYFLNFLGIFLIFSLQVSRQQLQMRRIHFSLYSELTLYPSIRAIECERAPENLGEMNFLLFHINSLSLQGSSGDERDNSRSI